MSDAERIAKLEARVEQLERVIAGLRAALGGGGAGAGAGAIATDRDLDSPRGDEKIKFDPRDWKEKGGEPHKGRTMSRCEPDFLDVLAETMDFFASRQTDQKKAGFDRLTAARARGWARRLRNGWKPPAPPPRPAFAGGNGASSFGGGGASSWGSSTNGSGWGRSNGFGAPPPTTDEPDDGEPSDDDTSFDFGANVKPPAPPPPPPPSPEFLDEDDDPPLS